MNDCLKKRENLKFNKGSRVYTIYGGDYKRKFDPNPNTNLIFMLVLGWMMLDLL